MCLNDVTSAGRWLFRSRNWYIFCLKHLFHSRLLKENINYRHILPVLQALSVFLIYSCSAQFEELLFINVTFIM